MRLKGNDLREIYDIVHPYTMVCEAGVNFTAQSVVRAIGRNVMGDMAECGTWRGGCGIAMLLAQRIAFGRVERKVHFFDSFAGLPPAEKVDGPDALWWQSSTTDNCVADQQELKDLLNKLNFKRTEYAIYKGWFEQTLPAFAENDIRLAVLRLDGDWYESTATGLQWMLPQVEPRGVVIVDDYYAWDGCARAVHDHLSRHDLPYRIKSLPKNSGAYFIKEQQQETEHEPET